MKSQNLPERPNLEQLKNQAKTLLRSARAKDPDALARFQAIPSLARLFPTPTEVPNIALHDAQFVIAREHGFKSWKELHEHVEGLLVGPAEAVDEFTGRVVDKFTRQPVKGAIVHVRRGILSSTERRVFGETEHPTDADGRFLFRLTPEESANRQSYLDFEVTHAEYARLPWHGYALRMIRKNQALGDRPFFEKLELTPAESIYGTLVQPNGAPAAGIKILVYSKTTKNDPSEYGSFADTKTDERGFFGINVIKGGEAVLWLLPHNFSPSTHLIHQRRGDLGQFRLEEGIRLNGRVLDSSGSPVSHVWVNAEVSGGSAQKPIDMPVADAFVRSALTNERGEFAMGPLPASQYNVLISESPRENISEDRTSYPIPDVFLHETLQLNEDRTTQSMEIRAVPSVALGIQQLDSQGNPHKSHRVHVTGLASGKSWWGNGRPDPNGKIRVRVPKGMSDVRIRFSFNEHQATRYRLSDQAAWRNEWEAIVPVLEQAIEEISVMHYAAPVLLVRAVKEDGVPIPKFKCQMTYAEDRKPYAQPPNWTNGDTGDVRFEKQQDGRWRSMSLLPDEEIVLMVHAEGFQPWSQTVRLAEGAIQEMEAKLVSQ